MKTNIFEKALYKSAFYVKRNMSTMLSGCAVIGIVCTAFTVGKDTPLALERLEVARKKKQKKLNAFETVFVVLPIYAPAIVMGGSTIACILGANVLNRRQQAALISAYAFAENSFKEYREKLIELHGEEADLEVRDTIVRTHCNYHQTDMDVPDDKLLFYEPFTKTYLICYEKEIMDAEYHFNRNFVLRGYAPLNEWLAFLGVPETEYGDAIGWAVSEGYYWVDFEHRLIDNEDGETCYVIDTISPPDAEYMRDWT